MASNVVDLRRYSRAVRQAPDPLGLYIRPARNDHREMLNVFSAGHVGCFGAVFDPTATLMKQHHELRELILERRLDAILDPKTQQMATIGAHTEALGELPWGLGRPHDYADFYGVKGRRLIASLADFTVENGFTQVLSPSHLLNSAEDEWLVRDVASTCWLRDQLDKKGGSHIPIIYSLSIPYRVFRNLEERELLVSALNDTPINALWLRIEGFESRGTSASVRRYIDAASHFHQLGIPVVADHVGGMTGLAVLAFGAVGGIAHGVTLGERFSCAHWRKPPRGRSFAQHRRVYVPELDLMLSPKEALEIVESSTRVRSMFSCKDTECCPRGARDMLEHPGRHFLCQRFKEVAELGQIPEQLRPQRFLEQRLRPATDRALRATRINWNDDVVAKKMRENRQRLDMLRVALGDHAAKQPPQSFSPIPSTRAARRTGS